MTPEEITDRAVERLLAAHSPMGRAKLQMRVGWKRLSWLAVVNATLFCKRLIDIAGSLLAMILLLPVFCCIALLVKLDGGPAFFRQTRIGLNGREFKMLKFRSMCLDAEARLEALLTKNENASGVTFKLKNDPRITRIGKLLRKSSLDELPQFWNVLCGDMSLVGPRPPVLREVALYSQADRRRLLVKPGITCLWQVGERRGDYLKSATATPLIFPSR